jgi:hypothetical protein
MQDLTKIVYGIGVGLERVRGDRKEQSVVVFTSLIKNRTVYS